MRPLTRVATVVVLAALAACGSGDDSTSVSSTATTLTPAATPAPDTTADPPEVASSTEPATEATSDGSAEAQPDPDRPTNVVLEWDPPDGIAASYLLQRPVQIPFGGAMGPDDNFYVADRSLRTVLRLLPDGTVDDLDLWNATDAFHVDAPKDVAFAPDGTLYVSNHDLVFKLGNDGSLTHVPMNGIASGGIAFGPDGLLYAADRFSGVLYRVHPDGKTDIVTMELPSPEDPTFGLDGSLYVTENFGTRVTKIDTATGELSEFATYHWFTGPPSLAVDTDGDIWLRTEGLLAQLSPTGELKPFTVDGITGDRYAVPGQVSTTAEPAVDSAGGIWLPSYTGHVIYLAPIGPDVFESRTVIEGFVASDLTVGPDGSVYSHSWVTGELLRISPDGTEETVWRTSALDWAFVAADPTTGLLYIATPERTIISLDPATGDEVHVAELGAQSLAVTADGTLYATKLHDDHSVGGIESIVKITGVDSYEVVVTDLAGERISEIEQYAATAISLCAAPDGIYVMSEQSHMLYHVDATTSDVTILGVADVPGAEPNVPGPFWTYYCVSAPDGTLYATGYSTFRLDDGELTLIASGSDGDPVAAGISPDGSTLYIAESGAVDVIPLP